MTVTGDDWDAEGQQVKTEAHEAGHAVLSAKLFGLVGAVTVEQGLALDGCAVTGQPFISDVAIQASEMLAPYVTWSPEVRNGIEHTVLGLLAGEAAELLLSAELRTGRQPQSVAEQAMSQVEDLVADELPPPSEAESDWATLTVRESHGSDAQRVAEIVAAMFGDDIAAGGAWLAHLECQARQLVWWYQDPILALARALAICHVLGADAVKVIIGNADAHRRP